jgi:uncharacterized protein (DUF608 family)
MKREVLSRLSHRGVSGRSLALPLGGIGTGNFAIGGDGGLRQWQLHNIPNHTGFLPNSFFALRVSCVEPPWDVRRVLQAKLPPLEEPAPGVTDHLIPDAGLTSPRWPAIAETRFDRAYPFGRVTYEDAELPISAELEAFTPFVPLDEQASSLPMASFVFTVKNGGPVRVHGWLLSAIQNVVGWDGLTPIDQYRCSLFGGQVNRVIRRRGATAILMDNPQLQEDHQLAGEMLLATTGPSALLPRFASGQEALTWVESLSLMRPVVTNDWSKAALDAAARSASQATVQVGPSPAGQTWSGALAAPFSLDAGETAEIEFLIAWRFPNHYVNFSQFGPGIDIKADRFWLGNSYSVEFESAMDVLDYYRDHKESLLAQSRAWSEAVTGSTLPAPVVETIEAQGSTVRSPTTFRTADGRFFGFEGALGESTMNWNAAVGGSCPVNCSHVWNYEQTISRLFPGLERSMREVEFNHLQSPDGHIPHRAILPLELPQLQGRLIGGPDRPALDGMLGAVLKVYREARQGAGLDWLRRYWPKLELLVGYVERTWDPERRGLLTGDQPVTYDISLHGPNMFIGSLWLAALRAMEEMAKLLEQPAHRYREQFEQSAARYDSELWNGEYYSQPSTGEAYDFGDGCLSDQLIGQWWAHQLELDHLLPVEHVKSALAAIVRYNLKHGFRGPKHGYRYFADLDDSGLLVCTWPRGGRPAVPVRYCDEVWTGVEYQVAAHCVMEGLAAEGLQLVEAVRGRYDGTRRNPYNEIECGDHYIRGAAAWSLLEAYTGFRYDALRSQVTVASKSMRFPFVAGTGWGTIDIDDAGVVTLHCQGGVVGVERIVMKDPGGRPAAKTIRTPLHPGESAKTQPD